MVHPSTQKVIDKIITEYKEKISGHCVEIKVPKMPATHAEHKEQMKETTHYLKQAKDKSRKLYTKKINAIRARDYLAGIAVFMTISSVGFGALALWCGRIIKARSNDEWLALCMMLTFCVIMMTAGATGAHMKRKQLNKINKDIAFQRKLIHIYKNGLKAQKFLWRLHKQDVK